MTQVTVIVLVIFTAFFNMATSHKRNFNYCEYKWGAN